MHLAGYSQAPYPWVPEGASVCCVLPAAALDKSVLRMTIATTDIRRLVENCLTDAYFAELPGFERGKVRDSYDLPDGRRIMITTDRQSAFDQVLTRCRTRGRC